MRPSYTIFPVKTEELLNSDARAPEALATDWKNSPWNEAEPIEIRHFHPASSSHRPIASAKLLYDERNLYLRFKVDDRYVVSTRLKYQEPVYRDSCVEFFVQPRSHGGYFNFEINCGGTLLLYYIEDPARVDGGFAKYTPVAIEHGRLVRITHSAPAVVYPETSEPMEWQIGCRIPLDVLEAYVGSLGPLADQTWHANFYKCARGQFASALGELVADRRGVKLPSAAAPPPRPLRFADRPSELADRCEALSVSE